MTDGRNPRNPPKVRAAPTKRDNFRVVAASTYITVTVFFPLFPANYLWKSGLAAAKVMLLNLTKQMSSFADVLREKLHLHLNSAHPDLHKSIYVLCIPSLMAVINAALYYLVRGKVNWASFGTAPIWTAIAYAAPCISLVGNLAATVVFVIFSRHKRVRSHSKASVSFLLTFSWFCTFLSLLVLQ
jgi:hypothetical protein